MRLYDGRGDLVPTEEDKKAAERNLAIGDRLLTVYVRAYGRQGRMAIGWQKRKGITELELAQLLGFVMQQIKAKAEAQAREKNKILVVPEVALNEIEKKVPIKGK